MTLLRLLKKGKTDEAATYLSSLEPQQRTHELDYALFAECNREAFDRAVVEWLVANGADVNARFNHCSIAGAAVAALTERTFGLIDYLVRHGVVPEKSSDVIIQAVEGRILNEGACLVEDSSLYQNIVRHLLKHGFDPNYTDEKGRTALHHIADSYGAGYDFSGVPNLLLILLASGARTDIKDSNGETPTSIAARVGDKRTLQLLQNV